MDERYDRFIWSLGYLNGAAVDPEVRARIMRSIREGDFDPLWLEHARDTIDGLIREARGDQADSPGPAVEATDARNPR